MHKGVFGLARKHMIGRVREGDKIVCCAGKGDWKIIGLGAAVSDYYLSDKKVFLKEGLFPDRFDFEANKLPVEKELDLMSVIDKLSFVTNPAYWAVYFRNGIVELRNHDWHILSEGAEAPVS